MRRSIQTAAPVITFLAPSPSAARQASALLSRLSGFQSVDSTDSHQNFIPSGRNFFPNIPWHSQAISSPNSKTILQWIYIDGTENRTDDMHELLAIQEADSLNLANKALGEALQKSISTSELVIRRMTGFPIKARHLLGRNTLPILDFSRLAELDTTGNARSEQKAVLPGELKELAIPFYDDLTYSNGKTLLDGIACTCFRRPVPGLYQFPNGLCLRPLPAGREDRSLAPPSLIFHLDDLDNLAVHDSLPQARIGFSGVGRGHVMVRHPNLAGLDVRFCENKKLRSMFAEAQESLLAGSLNELQSTHVLRGAKGKVDPKTLNTDCWVEFRANLSNPNGFWSSKRNPKIAKPPDLPYE